MTIAVNERMNAQNTNETDKVNKFINQLIGISTLVPREIKGKKFTPPVYTRRIVTIVGLKTATGRFLPVSHAGYSNETYVDKVDLLGKTRAEFIGRKLKGIERRAHMALFREMIEEYQKDSEQKTDWQTIFNKQFNSACLIPDKLCLACWNCSLFGGMESQFKKAGTFSRIRYFDTYSVEDASECIQTDDSPEQMAIGNTVGEDLSVERGEASFHRYEYVKAGTRFPFITIIESPTLLDVAGYISAVRLADQHGYGKYSANHGKFKTEFLAMSAGYPQFSVLDMLTWIEENEDINNLRQKLKFENVVDQAVILLDSEIESIQQKLGEAFKEYLAAIESLSSTSNAESGGRGRRGRRGE